MLETQRQPNRPYRVQIGSRGQPILFEPPSIRWRATSVVGQVERNHPESVGDFRVVHDMAELAGIVAGGVQAQQWNSAAGFLDENPMLFAADIDRQISSDDGLEISHQALPFRA